MNIIQNESSSILMSDELKDKLDLDDDTQFNLLKERSNILVIKYKQDDKNDVLLGQLRSCGIDKEHNVFTVECSVLQKNARNFLYDIINNNIEIFGIDIHTGESILVLLKTTDRPYEFQKCNLYDISMENEDCTLVLVIKMT